MISDLSWMPFKNISLDDPFFESLKDDYPGFDVWFKKKSLNGDKALFCWKKKGYMHFWL